MIKIIKTTLLIINIVMIAMTLCIADITFNAAVIWFAVLTVLSAVNILIWRKSSDKERNEYAFIEFFKNIIKED